MNPAPCSKPPPQTQPLGPSRLPRIIFSRLLRLMFSLAGVMAGILTACNAQTASPTLPQATLTATATPTPLLLSPLPPTPTTTPPTDRIMFYYFVPLTEPYPPGSVVVMPEAYMLAPQLSANPYSPDTAADLQIALEAALADERNGWQSTEVEIVAVAFSTGHATVVLQGEYFGVGSVTLIAAKMQLLLTIFANPLVQTATISLNGDTIGNLGIAHSLEAKPADYVFTRAEIDEFLAENLYASP